MIRTNPIPDKSVLQDLFVYREGALYWAKPQRGVRRGRPAGCRYADGYHWVYINKVKYSRHRLVYAYFHGDPGSLEIDHINRLRGDDRIENLRAVTRRQNKYNVSNTKANRSGHKGVAWDKANSKWIVHINTPDSHAKFLGRFTSKHEAIAAYQKAAQEIHGEFAYFPVNLQSA